MRNTCDPGMFVLAVVTVNVPLQRADTCLIFEALWLLPDFLGNASVGPRPLHFLRMKEPDTQQQRSKGLL